MYEELVKKLRSHNGWALNETLDKAADAIEKLTDFAHYVAREVVRDDDDWEDNRHYAFQEIACRKLVKLGIVDSIGGEYRYEPKEETE